MLAQASLRWSRPLAVVILLLVSLTALAQYSGNIQGVVTDPSEAAVAGASVRLSNADTGIEANATTSNSGNYRFSSLETGALEKDDHGKPRIIGKVQGNPNTFNGACTYRTAVAASGFLYSELKLKRRPFFQIFQTGPYPILPGE